MPTVKIRLPAPHPKQQAIIDSKAKRKVVVCGRRFGKTLCGALMASKCILDGKKCLISSTSQDQADIFWKYLRKWFAPLQDDPTYYKNETRREIRLPTGGELKVKTGRNADALKGFDADLVILDECAYLDPMAWFEVAAPMMADRNGTVVFFSTPLRKNWFYHLYQRAVQDATGRWGHWHATTLDNPHLSKDAVDELSSDMTEEGYKQEILAIFLEGAGQVFRNIEICAIAQPREPYPGTFIMGVDTAQKQDFSVMAVMDKQARRMVDLDRFNNVSWGVYQDRVKTLCDKWKCESIVFEINSVGSPNFEALQNDGLPVIAFETTGISKPPLIESLVLAFERREIAILDNPVLVGELGAYERKVNAITNRSQYSAPEGLHDDCVMALALAWHGCLQSTLGGFYF